MNLFRPFSVALLVTALSACGGGGGGDDSRPAATTHTNTVIHSFSVTGSDTDGDVTAINAGINEGAFSFRWNLSSDSLYHVDLYLSADTVANNSGDRKIFSRNCNVELSDCQSFSAEYPCNFTTENNMVCGKPGNITNTNVSSFVTTLPVDGYLVLKACNGLFDSCDEKSVKIQLQ